MEKFAFHNPTKFAFDKNTIRLNSKELAYYGFSKALILAGGCDDTSISIYPQLSEPAG